MPLITSHSTGRRIYTQSDFTIDIQAAFSLVSVLADALPSSEEGRAAFRITENIAATVQAIYSKNTAKEQYSEVIASVNVFDITDANSLEVEASHNYARMSDEHKKKIQSRLRKLLELVAKKEAIASNAELLVGNASMNEVDAEIAEYKNRINGLFAKYSAKPLVESQPLAIAVDSFIDAYASADDMSRDKLLLLLASQVNDGYTIHA